MKKEEKELIYSLEQIIVSIITREEFSNAYNKAKTKKKKNELADMIAIIDENIPDDEKMFISLLKKI